MKAVNMFSLGLLALTLSSCAIVRPGEVGLKQRLGKLQDKPLHQGAHGFNPFVATVIKVKTRTVEAFNSLDVPTKEGLTVKSEIALLYHVLPDAAAAVYVNYGTNYQEVIVESNFRAIVRHVSASYLAKELFAVDRKKIEKEIYDETVASIGDKGFKVDAVLLKSITMPPQIFQAVENKLKAEQETMQMEFTIAKQRKEAERMQIEADAIKSYNKTVAESLTEILIRWNGVQALKELSTSPSSKLIVTDGKSPMILGEK